MHTETFLAAVCATLCHKCGLNHPLSECMALHQSTTAIIALIGGFCNTSHTRRKMISDRLLKKKKTRKEGFLGPKDLIKTLLTYNSKCNNKYSKDQILLGFKKKQSYLTSTKRLIFLSLLPRPRNTSCTAVTKAR